jgi:hypothetical protein
MRTPTVLWRRVPVFDGDVDPLGQDQASLVRRVGNGREARCHGVRRMLRDAFGPGSRAG